MPILNTTLQPSAHISTFTEYYSSFNNSGTIKLGVPIYFVFLVSFSSYLTSPNRITCIYLYNNLILQLFLFHLT